jgi:hypothetical protein
MAKHTKPTPEELEESTEKALQEAEELKEKNEPEEEPEHEPEVEEKEEPEEDKETIPEDDKDLEEVDYKKKFTESSREAQILHAKNKKINEAVEKAKGLPDPTVEELTKEYPDWELLTDTEKRLAKDSVISTRRFAILEEVTAESKDIEAWNTKVDTFISDPKSLIKHPELDGKEEEFKIFASKPSRRSVDFEDLIPAFLYTAKQPAKKGAMFETGSGGPNDKSKPKSDKLSIDQARKLRERDYNKWKEYLSAGKIESV